MTHDQILGLIRHILTAVGGVLVAKGIADEGTVTTVVGGLIGIGGAIWSWWDKREAA